MTTYFTAVSDDLLPVMQAGIDMPACLRVKHVVGRIFAPYGRMTLVELEDDDADPVFYQGRTVTPTIESHYDVDGTLTHTAVAGREIDNTRYQVVF